MSEISIVILSISGMCLIGWLGYLAYKAGIKEMELKSQKR